MPFKEKLALKSQNRKIETDLAAQSQRPLLQPTVRNIFVHIRGRISFEGYRLGPIARKIMGTVKACGRKGKILFTKEQS